MKRVVGLISATALSGFLFVAVPVGSADASSASGGLRRRRLQGIGMIDPRTVEMKDGQPPPPGYYDTAVPPPNGEYPPQQQQQLPGGYADPQWGGGPPPQGYGGGPPPPQGGYVPYDPNGQMQKQGSYGAPPQQGYGPPAGTGYEQGTPQDPNADSPQGGGGYSPQQGYGAQGEQEQQQQEYLPQQQDGYGTLTLHNDSQGAYGAPPPQGGGYGQQQAQGGPSLLQPQGYSTGGYTSTDGQQQMPPTSSSQSGAPGAPGAPHSQELPNEDTADKIKIASKDKPSYGLLCDKLLKRHHAKTTDGPLYIVQEDPAVCTSPDTFESLYTMMVATIVAQGGSMWRISYQHNCKPQDAPSIDITQATIQQMLPNDLTLAMGAGMDTVAEMCKKWHSDKGSGIQAMGFPVEGVIETPDPVLNINRATAFRHNVQSAVQTILAEESKLHEVPSMDRVVVIHLDTESPSRGLTGLDFDYYTSRIPQKAAGVDIVMSQSCQANPNCEKYGDLLQKSLAEKFSHAPITLEKVPSTAIGYARMMQAPLLICPPTLSCLLPVMWKGVYTISMLKEQPELYPWYQYMVREAKKNFHLQIEYEKEGE